MPYWLASRRSPTSRTATALATPFAAPEVDVVLQVVVEQVVAGDHDHVVVDDPGAVEREGDVADRAEPVVVRARPVVVDGHAGLEHRPVLEVPGEAAVRDDVHLVDLLDLADPLQDPVDHRLAPHRQQALREIVGQRLQAGRVAAGEDDRLHRNRCSLTASRPSSGPHWCAIPRASNSASTRAPAPAAASDRRSRARVRARRRGSPPPSPAPAPAPAAAHSADRGTAASCRSAAKSSRTSRGTSAPPAAGRRARRRAATPSASGRSSSDSRRRARRARPGRARLRSRRSPRRARRPAPSVSATTLAVTNIGV